MKPNIHPKYKEIKVTCSCGNKFTTHSTLSKDELHLDICSNCHPFYTGKQKLIDTAGRVDRFKKRYEVQKEVQAKAIAAKAQKMAEDKASPAKGKVASQAKTQAAAKAKAAKKATATTTTKTAAKAKVGEQTAVSEKKKIVKKSEAK